MDSWKETCPLDQEQVTKAVKALKAYINKTQESGKILLEEHSRIQFQINLHRIPAIKEKSIFFTLPHPLYTKDAEVCVITKDIDKKDPEKSELHFKDLLAKHKITNIAKIIPIRQLKLDYRSYEAKRKLSDMYDLFLCDRALLYRMHSLMGKLFYSKRKDPWPVDMGASNLSHAINRTLSKTRWFISGGGPSSLIVVAKTTFPISHIVENIMTCAVEVAKEVPRGWGNVHSIHIKTDTSLALPIYVNDEAVDVDFYEKRETEFLDRMKKRKEAVMDMWDMVGIENKRTKRTMVKPKRKELKKEKSAAE